MAEYKDVELLRKQIAEFKMLVESSENSDYLKGYITGKDAVMEAIDELPAADVQEVVRCRDCKHLFLAPRGNPHLCMRSYFSQPVTFEDYCSYGERKDGEENENV